MAAVQTVARLSALTLLDMWSFNADCDEYTPRCVELACLRNASLQELSTEVSVAVGAGPRPRL
jgi:hypothetical protein